MTEEIISPEQEIFSLERDINWTLFTEKEKALLVAAYQNGLTDCLVCLPGVSIATPEQELEIEKMVLSQMPLTGDETESEVRQELDVYMAKGGKIETPEEEQKWQAKIEAENEKRRLALQKRKDEVAKEIARKSAKKTAQDNAKAEVKLDKDFKEAEKVIDENKKDEERKIKLFQNLEKARAAKKAKIEAIAKAKEIKTK